MATKKSNDESFVERDEVLFPDEDLVDVEPLYKNFATIQNELNNSTHNRSHSSDNRYRAVRTQIESSLLRHSQSDDQLSINSEYSSSSFTIPISIQSKKIDGHIFNLSQIVQDIGYKKSTPITSSTLDPNTKNVSALLNIVLKAGGAHGPLVNVWRSRITDEYFQRWYLEKYYQRSASLPRYNTNEKMTQNTRARDDYKSNTYMNNFRLPPTTTTNQVNNQNHYESEVQKIYGYDDADVTTASIASSHSSSNDTISHTKEQRSSSITSILKKSSNSNNTPTTGQTPPIKHHVTIRERHSSFESDQSISSQQLNTDDMNLLSESRQYQKSQTDSQEFENIPSPYDHFEKTTPIDYSQIQQTNYDIRSELNTNSNPILSEYQQVLQTHPDVHHDPNPEIISKPNPTHQVTYEQNISLRYLVPPTPPPPGPLIIREILPPRIPTPPPFIVKVPETIPQTPPPLILREAPPPPPPHQETTFVTKMLPPELPPARCVVYEHAPPLPPKPQSIIIEKWLPYKPAPPREVIVERITEKPVLTEFEPGAITYERQRRHSAEFHTDSSRLEIPINMSRQKSVDHLAREQMAQQPSGTFDELVWTTHQQILAMQQRGREQVQASQQWAANQWQQHQNMFMQYPTHLTTPTLVVCHPPVTTNAPTAYIQTEEYREQRVKNTSITIRGISFGVPQQSPCTDRRFLHYTLKITDRLETKKFFCDILGMNILRHEEMDSGCSAQCNGNFESPWSKTVASYGDEHSYFAFELNYNYDVQGYKYGNDFASITIHNRQAVINAQKYFDQSKIISDKQSLIISSPDGHRFILVDKDVGKNEDPVKCLSLNVFNLDKSIEYYTKLLNMNIVKDSSDEKRVKLSYDVKDKSKSQYDFRLDQQCQLELIEIKKEIDRGTGYGRKAFSCPVKDIDTIENLIEKEGYKILIPKMKLGGLLDFNKNTVIILSDPDGHEVCFVGEENYSKTCEIDSDAKNKFNKNLKNPSKNPEKYEIGEDKSTKHEDK
ncbi:unnamed protein product [Adineta steineri]|uniref:VOC domain-containing protein n=1 Tax=Adineta steineri TaxID=433720 RepID=A0A813ZE28_9BILA|nr:unnamed protein product [Adineta steineri]CAF1458678.1 unnamed protein product [Adineta steineri]